MGMRELREAFRLIEENDGDFDGPKEPSLVDSAANALGFRFPPTYRRFLETYGCGDISGIEIFGVIDDNFKNNGIPDAIWLTLRYRKTGLPERYLLISSDGDGAYCALDADQADENGEYQVVRYEIDGAVFPLSKDFGTFLLSEIESAL